MKTGVDHLYVAGFQMGDLRLFFYLDEAQQFLMDFYGITEEDSLAWIWEVPAKNLGESEDNK